LTAELAILAVLRTRYGFAPQWFAGHSLGEYTALVAAGVMDAGAAAALVRERGRVLQEAVAVGVGAMTAVLAAELDIERLQALLGEGEPLTVDVANLNSSDQVVLSGAAGDVARAVERLKADPAFARARAIPLRVSAPFHSRLMQPAAERFRGALERAAASWRIEHAPSVLSNLTGGPHRADRAGIADALTRQIASPVRWGQCMSALRERSERVVEIGPGKTLAGFFKGMGVAIESISDVGAAKRVFDAE
jgi:[acyl-carrier-protein] S-malonyltransferase/trans-AT polyketide synthase/acyltransferase/oxidoreductase domain-containing protein